MTKSIKRGTKRARAQREAKRTKQAEGRMLAELCEREANTLIIGIDLGDRVSTYCVRSLDQGIVTEGTVATTPPAILKAFEKLRRQRMVLETGTHSRWLAQLLDLMGHEVIVANARKLKLISENNQKSDKVDARLLSALGCTNTAWLHPVYVRGDRTHCQLAIVRAREGLVEARTKLINHVRGSVKAYGCRIRSCDAKQFAEAAASVIPESMRAAMQGVLAVVDELSEQVYGYDRQIEHLCQTERQETRWLLQVSGVGPLTALTYVLTIEDAGRFERSREVGPYLGLVAKKRQSGKRDPQLGISKAGDEMLRKLLVNCAHQMLGPHGADSDLRRWGQQLVAASEKAGKKRGAKKRAATAVARKLAVLLHRLWAGQAEYEPLRNSNRGVAAA